MIIIKILVGLFVLERLFAGPSSNTCQPITELILSVIDNLCPYSRICKRFDEGSKLSDQTGWTSGDVPCCGACSCGDDCGKIGKCCFSGDNYMSRHYENYTVKSDRRLGDEVFNYSCLFPGTTQNVPKWFRLYDMIDTCPFKSQQRSKTQEKSAEKCGDYIVAWSSLFPVYSPSTKRLYKNNVCSRCHKVTDGVVWDISMTCLSEKKSRHVRLDISEVISIDPEGQQCFLTFNFPGNWSDIEHERCITESLVNDCSGASFIVPARINMTSAEVVEACESNFYSPVFSSRTNQATYANVFCSICNSDYKTSRAMCPNPNAISRDGGQFSFLLKGTDILEKYVDKQNTVKEIRKACLHMPQSIMKHQDCRRIYCQTGQIRDPAGECHYVSTFMFTTFELTIDLLPKNHIPTEFIKPGISSLTDGWLKGPFKSYWKLIRLLFEPYPAQGKNYIRKFTVSLRMKTSISIEVLLKNVKRLMREHWYANLNGTIIEFRQEFSRIYDFSKKRKETHCTNSSISKDNDSICVLTQLLKPINAIELRSLIITKMVFCEQVELRESEYGVIMTKRAIYYKLRKLILFEGEFVSVFHPLTGNYTVRMCLADAGFKIFYDSASASVPNRTVHICLITLFFVISIKRNF